MKFIDRIRARHDLKAKGMTSQEAAQAVHEMEIEGIEPVVTAAAPVATPAVEEVVEEEVVEEDDAPVSNVTDDGVVIAGEETRAQEIADTTQSEFEDMTVVELRDLASEFDIEGRSGMDKAELVAALEAL